MIRSKLGQKSSVLSAEWIPNTISWFAYWKMCKVSITHLFDNIATNRSNKITSVEYFVFHSHLDDWHCIERFWFHSSVLRIGWQLFYNNTQIIPYTQSYWSRIIGMYIHITMVYDIIVTDIMVLHELIHRKGNTELKINWIAHLHIVTNRRKMQKCARIIYVYKFREHIRSDFSVRRIGFGSISNGLLFVNDLLVYRS